MSGPTISSFPELFSSSCTQFGEYPLLQEMLSKVQHVDAEPSHDFIAFVSLGENIRLFLLKGKAKMFLSGHNVIASDEGPIRK